MLVTGESCGGTARLRFRMKQEVVVEWYGYCQSATMRELRSKRKEFINKMATRRRHLMVSATFSAWVSAVYRGRMERLRANRAEACRRKSLLTRSMAALQCFFYNWRATVKDRAKIRARITELNHRLRLRRGIRALQRSADMARRRREALQSKLDAEKDRQAAWTDFNETGFGGMAGVQSETDSGGGRPSDFGDAGFGAGETIDLLRMGGGQRVLSVPREVDRVRLRRCFKGWLIHCGDLRRAARNGEECRAMRADILRLSAGERAMGDGCELPLGGVVDEGLEGHGTPTEEETGRPGGSMVVEEMDGEEEAAMEGSRMFIALKAAVEQSLVIRYNNSTALFHWADGVCRDVWQQWVSYVHHRHCVIALQHRADEFLRSALMRSYLRTYRDRVVSGKIGRGAVRRLLATIEVRLRRRYLSRWVACFNRQQYLRASVDAAAERRHRRLRHRCLLAWRGRGAVLSIEVGDVWYGNCDGELEEKATGEKSTLSDSQLLAMIVDLTRLVGRCDVGTNVYINTVPSPVVEANRASSPLTSPRWLPLVAHGTMDGGDVLRFVVADFR
ncbi:hypothetical protein FOZ61_009140 [Perkinsus olseni]|uniref:Uncharacterized protein n=1 Tax=Perkinsus olseni TaxID=32597 RepID=A0A7J6L0U5_PEROL|nr:hypothetical protein FOZ61_009140 [Perkinsus olseni]